MSYDQDSEYSYSFVHLSDVQTLTTAYPSTLNLAFSRIEGLKSPYNISAIFITGDLTNEYDGGPGDGTDFARYAHSVTLTTIPVYEISGNHDVAAIGNYAAWDMYVPSGSTKHDYGLVFNDFRVYGFGWNGENAGLNPSAKSAMQSFITGDPTKTPLILIHGYYPWGSPGTRTPGAYEILDSLPRGSIVMSGHSHAGKGSNGLIRQIDYNGIPVIEDFLNYQDWGDFSGGRLYTITSDGTRITGMQVSDLFLYPELAVRNPISYNLSSTENPPATGSITVTAPNGGESWAAGSTQRIMWTSSGDAGSHVNIELLKGDAVVQTIASGTENDGSYSSWTISTGLASGSDYRVRVTSTTYSAITDTSNAFFAITGGTSTGSITVTAPNGGESWAAGSTQRIMWTSSGDAGSHVKIELLKGDAIVQTILASTENDGSYSSWTISTGLAAGSDYRVRVTSTTYPAVTDTSNSGFTITGGTSSGSVTVTSTPSGARIFLDGADTTRVTPYTLTSVPAGNHNVYVTLSGYATPTTQVVPVVNGQTATADFTLVQETGSVTVTSTPSGAKIFLDGTDTSHVTPYTLTNVAVGTHTLYVTLNGYITPATQTKAVTRDTITTFDFPLTSSSQTATKFVARTSGTSDGLVQRSSGTGESFTSLRNGAGTGADPTTGYLFFGISSANNNNPGLYGLLQRTEFLFDTSGLPDNAVIINATVSIWSGTSSSFLSQLGSTSYGITGVNPVTPGVVSQNDYQRVMNTRYSDTDIPQASIANYNYNSWIFNSNGISSISKTGWTNVIVRTKWDIDNDTTGLTWLSSEKTTQILLYAAEGHTGKEPTLTIYYTLPSGNTIVPVAHFVGSPLSGTSPLTVTFTDLSTNTPASWLWSFGDGSTENSTMQNPVHRYANPGTYTVSLTATNSAGSASKTQAGYVTVTSTSSITVIVPHGGESWTTGSTYGITWTSSGNVGSSVNIELLKGNSVVQAILSNTENDGSYSSWSIPPSLATGSDYRVRVTSVSDPAISGISNGFFSITSPAPSASITVTAPNGGESWVAGTKHWISWTSSGSAGSYVTIELLKGDIVIQTIVSSTKNNGGYKWTVPKGLVTGTDYRVRVTSVTNPAVTDTGNGDFTIR